MNSIQEKQSLELISIIGEQVETLVSYTQGVPQIEVDIVKENLRKLYEIVDAMGKGSFSIKEIRNQEAEIDHEIDNLMDLAKAQFNDELEEQIKEQEEVLDEQVKFDKREPEIPDEPTISKVHKENFEHIAEPAIDKQQPKEEAPKPPMKKEKPVKESGERKIHVLDVVPDMDEEEEEKSLMGERITKKAISSLKSSIGINDKFMFINDLFEGNTKRYNKSIQALDSLHDRQSALYLLGDMKDENLWEKEDPAFQQLKSYIERRY